MLAILFHICLKIQIKHDCAQCAGIIETGDRDIFRYLRNIREVNHIASDPTYNIAYPVFSYFHGPKEKIARHFFQRQFTK